MEIFRVELRMEQARQLNEETRALAESARLGAEQIRAEIDRERSADYEQKLILGEMRATVLNDKAAFGDDLRSKWCESVLTSAARWTGVIS
jgi:phage-related minor tail protein